MKDCFGTVISSLKKMKECVVCELLIECRSMNWKEGVSRVGVSREDASQGDPAAGPARGGAAGS